MTPKNFTNLPKSIAHDLKIFYCPVCGLRFTAHCDRKCPECGCGKTLELNSEHAKAAADTHKNAVNLLYALVKMQMRDAQ